MSRRAFLSAIAAFALLSPVVVGTTAAAQTVCDPFTTTPHYLHQAPSSTSVLGFALGSQEVSFAQSNQYMDAVDAASDRVITGALEIMAGPAAALRRRRSHRSITPSPSRRSATAATALRDPTTPRRRPRPSQPRPRRSSGSRQRARRRGERHRRLAAGALRARRPRRLRGATQILDNAIVVILPTQNPDGREADTRRNAYGFDMNRDWFARTQPETDGKLELLRHYPPVLFIDAHEMGGKDYFFPPNADPIYHEITDESVDWINDLYGAGDAARVRRAQGIPYFNYDVYDLFYMGYGDTVPADRVRRRRHDVREGERRARRRARLRAVPDPVGVAVGGGRATSATILDRLARRRGVRGRTSRARPASWSPTRSSAGQQLSSRCPTEPVRHYFLRADDPAKAREVQALVRRLQRMDVEVYRLHAPLTRAGLHAVRPRRRADDAAGRAPTGSRWPRRQKHWVQAMLNEDTYTPFPYFYDVTAWSNPLLFNLHGGWTGARSCRRARGRRRCGAARPTPPAVAGGRAVPAPGQLGRRVRRPAALAARQRLAAAVPNVTAAHRRRLPGIDVLLVPNGSANDGLQALGAGARRRWPPG